MLPLPLDNVRSAQIKQTYARCIVIGCVVASAVLYLISAVDGYFR